MKNLIYKLKERLHDKSGEILTHTVLTIIVYFVMTIVVFNVIILTFHFFSLHYTARAVARVIEREGGLNTAAYDMLDDLNDDFNITATLTSNPPKKIQYMEHFEVVIEDEHVMRIMTPIGLNPLEYDFPMKATVTGMSEVYWKELL